MASERMPDACFIVLASPERADAENQDIQVDTHSGCRDPVLQQTPRQDFGAERNSGQLVRRFDCFLDRNRVKRLANKADMGEDPNRANSKFTPLFV